MTKNSASGRYSRGYRYVEKGEKMKLKSYLAEMAKLSDNEWTGGLEETANWYRKSAKA